MQLDPLTDASTNKIAVEQYDDSGDDADADGDRHRIRNTDDASDDGSDVGIAAFLDSNKSKERKERTKTYDKREDRYLFAAS